jgi:hypothetical protein
MIAYKKTEAAIAKLSREEYRVSPKLCQFLHEFEIRAMQPWRKVIFL